MSKVFKAIKSCRFEIPRRYALWRIGATREESRSYNTTDRVLLTFDDYGTGKTVLGTLRILREQGIRAVFFLQGNWANDNPKLVKKIAADGHWLANHTYSHPHLLTLSDSEVKQELTKGLRARLMRPPYGEYDDRIRSIAARMGFKIGFWTIDSNDWKDISAQEIQQVVLPRLHKGACILLHLNTSHTLEALPGLIAGIRARGYELCRDGTEIKA